MSAPTTLPRPRRPRLAAPPARGCGFDAIHPTALWPMAEVARRMGWERRSREKAVRDGLRTMMIGRIAYTRGVWLLEWIEKQEARP